MLTPRLGSMTVGIDEAGRGAWAGPLVAAAVILPVNHGLQLRDSKTLSRIQLKQMSYSIKAIATSIGLGWVSSVDIDMFGLTYAQTKTMGSALELVDSPEIGNVVIDGNINYLSSDNRTKAIINGDATHDCIMAAGIIAKVARDSYMASSANLYPGYSFDKHVGYGTKIHRQSMLINGVIVGFHRFSFKPVRASV